MTRKVLVIGDLLIFLRFFIFFFQDISKHLKDFPALVALQLLRKNVLIKFDPEKNGTPLLVTNCPGNIMDISKMIDVHFVPGKNVNL